jgi:hypothetical protein
MKKVVKVEKLGVGVRRAAFLVEGRKTKEGEGQDVRGFMGPRHEDMTF